MSTRKDLAASVTPETECAFRPSEAHAAQLVDGTWEARWSEPDGRGGAWPKTKAGFNSEEKALAFARKVELATRLNRC
jgi:hypothetical protein